LIQILDWGLGNPKSVKNMLDYLSFDSELINNPKKLSLKKD